MTMAALFGGAVLGGLTVMVAIRVILIRAFNG